MNIAWLMARHLEFLGFGTLDKDLFWGWTPDKPNTAVCIYCHDAGAPGGDRPARLQIITRAPSPAASFDLSERIAESLDEYSGYLAGDGCNANVYVVNSSVGIGDDNLHRSVYSTNITVSYCDAE